jgi:hypothetical protein
MLAVKQSVSIPAGASGLSDIIALTQLGRATRLDIGAIWVDAVLTFQVSNDDGATWSNLYDIYGAEYTVQGAASRAVVLPLADWLGITHFKIRSGRSGAPVNQTSGATVIVTSVV